MEKAAQKDVKYTAGAATVSMDYVTLDVSQDGPESFVNKVEFIIHTYLLCFTVFIFDHVMAIHYS